MFGIDKELSRLKESSSAMFGGVSNAVLALRREDIGWEQLGVDMTSDFISLQEVHKHAALSRQMTVNPLVKRALVVRNAYMWSDQHAYDGDSGVIARNKKQAFSVSARVRDEAAFATDGCVTYLVNKSTGTVYAIPVSRITSVATFEDGSVAALLVSSKTKTTTDSGQWVHVWDSPLAGTAELPNRDDTYPVSTELTAVQVTTNQLTGESLGKPDLMAAVYYAQAYKEYLTTAYVLTKALAKIAFKATGANARQGAAVRQHMAGSGIGGMASVGMGQDISAVNKAGAGISFTEGAPLAAMVSSALDIPLSVLLTDGSAGGRQGAEAALEDPTFKALDLRRQLHADLVAQLGAALGVELKLVHGVINNDQTHRRVQSLTMAFQSGAIHQSEYRSGVLQVLAPMHQKGMDDLPELPQVEDSSVGALSDGTNDNRKNTTDA